MVLRSRVFRTVVIFGLAIPMFAVAANIRISTVRSLTFPQKAQGDAAGTVTAGSAQSAQFSVTGDPSATYNIILPSSVAMKKGGDTLNADTFASSPASPGQLSGSGQQDVYVGATHETIGGSQPTGSYSGNFTVTVQYTAGGKSNSSTTTANIFLIAAIAIAKVSDLNFGTSTTGDSSITVTPGGTGTAQFTVGGEPSTAYTITLPSSATMTTGDGAGATKQIVVNSFGSTPSGTGMIGGGGTETLYVGATRAAILSNQVTGNYSGTFSVTVAY